MPLLEHSLLQLWERRRGQTLTYQACQDIGRLTGALKRHADEVYESFTEDRDLVRKIFLRLTQRGESAEDIRRRAKRRDLLQLGESYARVLNRPVDARLLTASRDVTTDTETDEDDWVEVAHEALIAQLRS